MRCAYSGCGFDKLFAHQGSAGESAGGGQRRASVKRGGERRVYQST